MTREDSLRSKEYFEKLFADIKKLPAWFHDEEIEDGFVLVSAMRPSGQHQFHAKLPEKMSKEEFIEPAIGYLGYKAPHVGVKPDFKSVEFSSRLALGDAMMMTCGIRDFKAAFPEVKVKVKSIGMHVWDNNPYIDQDINPEKTINCGTAWLTNASNRLNLHMANAYRLSIQNETGLAFEQGPISPDIWLSEEEYNAAPIIPGPYWLIVKGGEPGWPLKMYPIEGWQAVVDALPQIKFVELGTSEHVRAHGKLKNNKGNLVEMVGKTQDPNTGIRDLFKIFLHAQGSVGLVSMHMHLSSAFGNPCVVVAGAREPAWFTQYYGHIYLHTNGLLPCAERRACWHCTTPTCKNLVSDSITPKCVDLIKPQEIVNSILKYYEGGRLKFDKKILNTFFHNVAKKATSGIPVREDGLVFSGITISQEGWNKLEKYCKDTAPQRILEYGPGVSTILFKRYADIVHSIEAEPDKYNKGLDTIVNKPEGRYDFAFIDGPKGGWKEKEKTKIEDYSRFASVQDAMQYTDTLIMHNAFRDAERRVCDKLLAGWTKDDLGVDRGMVIYTRTNDLLDTDTRVEGSIPSSRGNESVVTIAPTKGLVKILTSGRGYGGSEKSSLMLMRMFLEDGYRVEFVNWGGPDKVGKAFKDGIPKGVKFPGTLVGECDHLVYYCTDTVYHDDFNDPKMNGIFEKVHAKNKVMILNYKLGDAGKMEWTKRWSKYAFLNSQIQGEFLKRMPEANTFFLPPPTDLTDFFAVERNYTKKLKLIRHNSQHDAKWPKDVNEFLKKIWAIDPKIEFYFMPAATFMMDDPRIHKYRVNELPVPEFLKLGNCFMYNLPDGYSDAGPRVILESQATGLAVIADNRWGAKDRVTESTGWLCDSHDDYMRTIRDIVEVPSLLRTKGQAARKWAKKMYDPHLWIEEILK